MISYLIKCISLVYDILNTELFRLSDLCMGPRGLISNAIHSEICIVKCKSRTTGRNCTLIGIVSGKGSVAVEFLSIFILVFTEETR